MPLMLWTKLDTNPLLTLNLAKWIKNPTSELELSLIKTITL